MPPRKHHQMDDICLVNLSVNKVHLTLLAVSAPPTYS